MIKRMNAWYAENRSARGLPPREEKKEPAKEAPKGGAMKAGAEKAGN